MAMRNYKEMATREFSKARITFQKMCYELYKLRWENEKASLALKTEKYLQFMKDQLAGKTDYKSFHYCLLNGYVGTDCFLMYPDFMCTKYLDAEYMKELLGDDSLFEEYQAIVDEFQERLGRPDAVGEIRTRQETFDYFYQLAAELTAEADKNNDAVARAKAEAYQHAAFELENNMLPEYSY